LEHLVDEVKEEDKKNKALSILMKKMEKYFPNGGLNFSCEMIIMRK
jgi:hypothetical protein